MKTLGRFLVEADHDRASGPHGFETPGFAALLTMRDRVFLILRSGLLAASRRMSPLFEIVTEVIGL